MRGEQAHEVRTRESVAVHNNRKHFIREWGETAGKTSPRQGYMAHRSLADDKSIRWLTCDTHFQPINPSPFFPMTAANQKQNFMLC